jgi:hypothetical protein
MLPRVFDFANQTFYELCVATTFANQYEKNYKDHYV